jgi:hypothetical protein
MTHTTGFVSVPASAFTGRQDDGVGGYDGNETGTARFFQVKMFAPVHLPHGATVTSFRGGGRAFFQRSIRFTLRRNEPQQANVDMAAVRTTLDGTSFEFVDTTDIQSGGVDNGRFNYYIVAEIEDPNVTPPTKPICPDGECRVGFCRIGYTLA